jgi:hypothetical protein
MRESGEEEGVSETETEIYCESRVQQRVCVWLGGWIADDHMDVKQSKGESAHVLTEVCPVGGVGVIAPRRGLTWKVGVCAAETASYAGILHEQAVGVWCAIVCHYVTVAAGEGSAGGFHTTVDCPRGD